MFNFQRMKKLLLKLVLFSLPAILVSCTQKNVTPSKALIDKIDLKRGEVISCGLPDKQFGSVNFDISGSEGVKKDFNLAIALLHSFEYDEAEKVFARIIDAAPECAMAYWGVAMCNFHPLWTPPSESELKKGVKAVEIAKDIRQKSKRETAYIQAIASFYDNWDKAGHHTRCTRFEKGMEKVYAAYPKDKEAAVLYALALDASADPADKSFKNQKKAGYILSSLYPAEPNHPGIAHYIIHTYDYPGLAELALPAARKYASVAPSSAHALHMPSHIFTRLGLWDECIRSNLASVASAQCYAEAAGIKGHWDEELHGLDYLIYAYLQKGENAPAKKQWDYLAAINDVYPVNFKVAYAFAAIPSRFLLENKAWEKAAKLEVHPANFPWKNFPWQEAIVHFTRLMGAIHTGKMTSAKTELQTLNRLYDTLTAQKDTYKANQVQVQIKTSQAWMQLKEGKNKEALALMNVAAGMEDNTEKHPVTPGEVLPAKELLGDMLLKIHEPGKALQAYEADLQTHPNRFNGLYGAGLAAERSGEFKKAGIYYRQLLTVAEQGNSGRPELNAVRLFLKRY